MLAVVNVDGLFTGLLFSIPVSLASPLCTYSSEIFSFLKTLDSFLKGRMLDSVWAWKWERKIRV